MEERFLTLTILSLLLGTSAWLWAQDDKPQQDKPPRQEEPNTKQDEAKPTQQEEKQNKQDEKAQKQGHANGQGGHIPEDKFRAHFSRSHTFTAKTVIVAGQPEFQYGGYTFEIVDVWPVGWAYTDQCYIDYVDGEYFLFDLLHPGIRVAIFVML